MPHQSIRLEVIDIARPCPADWTDMRGNDRVRFCNHCSLHVYNLSAMPRAEAERLVSEAEGRLCVRMYRRLDGTVITQDCGGGWRLAAKRLGRFARTATAVVLTAALAPLGLTRWLDAAPTDRASESELCVTPPTQQEPAIMGDMIAPPAPPKPPQVFLGRIAPAKMGQVQAVPLMGAPAPLPPNPPPAATQPVPATPPAATQPATE